MQRSLWLSPQGPGCGSTHAVRRAPRPRGRSRSISERRAASVRPTPQRPRKTRKGTSHSPRDRGGRHRCRLHRPAATCANRLLAAVAPRRTTRACICYHAWPTTRRAASHCAFANAIVYARAIRVHAADRGGLAASLVDDVAARCGVEALVRLVAGWQSERPPQDPVLEELVDDLCGHEAIPPAVRVSRRGDLEHVPPKREREVHKSRVGLLCDARLDQRIDRRDVIQGVLDHQRPLGVRVKGHHYDEGVRVHNMDGLDHTPDVGDSDGRDLGMIKEGSIVALVLAVLLLEVVHPSRQHHDISHARILRDVRHAHHLVCLLLPRPTTPTIEATHIPSRGLSEEVQAGRLSEERRVNAIVHRIVGKAPAAPTGPRDQRRRQARVLGLVVADGRLLRLEGDVLMRVVPWSHDVLQPLQIAMQLARPCLPDHVAPAHKVDAQLATRRNPGALLLHDLVLAIVFVSLGGRSNLAIVLATRVLAEYEHEQDNGHRDQDDRQAHDRKRPH
mmetsp:Transcript_18957/g.54926  ORF Transcript_18957/g.54926 Transcript_18957/m.54926 type:complete len:504 (+) Transcript_18957:288-1799(+)